MLPSMYYRFFVYVFSSCSPFMGIRCFSSVVLPILIFLTVVVNNPFYIILLLRVCNLPFYRVGETFLQVVLEYFNLYVVGVLNWRVRIYKWVLFSFV